MASLDRTILTGPDWVARSAASAVKDRRQRWMLLQPRSVRRSYAAEVHGRPDEARRAERWMLLQPDAVRLSYVEKVLDRERPADRVSGPPAGSSPGRPARPWPHRPR
ncbi:MAG: hypothetical protein QOG68_1891 [Solirubrobacteraceae bacterium]|jgi:hypothetical protein|nr:hypothetical protein [Solirubrobacteraceae bacterium]